MSQLHWPLLEAAILIPLVGALVVSRITIAERARYFCLALASATFACTLAAWFDFNWSHFTTAHDQWDLVEWITGHDWIVVDELSAPLLPLVSLVFLLTALATLRTKVRRFSFAMALFSEAIVLATLTCREPWGLAVLATAAALPPYLVLRSRNRPTGVYAVYMGLFVACLWVGVALASAAGGPLSDWALAPLVVAVLIRSGIAPLHCWMTDLFEHAAFGTALLFVTPMTGAYLAVRLLLPVAPDWILQGVGMLALATSVYAAGLALVQREVRRFFCYIVLSHSALVLVGLDTLTPIGLTGALGVWLSLGLSLAGFGLTLRALEARHGRLALDRYHGLYEHTPELAVGFLLTGLASVGFPGTFGFLSAEMLVDGAVQAFPYVGIAVVVAAALNGIAVLQVYFRLFTGTRRASSVPLAIGPRERIAVLTLAVLVLGGAIYPQPGIVSRHHAATSVLSDRRQARGPASEPLADAAAAQKARREERK
jgi:NADH-quinone oxidoreductase subunit M